MLTCYCYKENLYFKIVTNVNHKVLTYKVLYKLTVADRAGWANGPIFGSFV